MLKLFAVCTGVVSWTAAPRGAYIETVGGTSEDTGFSRLSLKDLSASEFSRLSTLFDESIDMAPGERETWLAALESGEPRLGALLREMFAHMSADQGRRFLETNDLLARHSVVPALLGQGNSAPEKSASNLVPGERVGPYELVRLLGAGGMAEVWLAKRADGAFKREVALKLPMVSRLRKDLEERFIRERDILASLEHPNIARLYDGGLDAQGLPYLAMEYVPGEALTTWCDAKRLGVAQRLALLHQVLRALQYAHDRHVIHRDLKPSNILLSEAGEVRLLDFGVAKLLEETEGAQLTRLYGRPLTPDYASPEQLKGDALDARSDVYSAGVLLYELLTGNRPYALNAAASVGSLEQALATVEVRRPSNQLEERAGANRGTTQEKLAHELRGDLDVITLKALAKEPGERYESVAAMAEDIERYLQHRPIKARPAPLSYRAKKFMRRNRPMIGVSALAGLLVLAIGGYELEHRLAIRAPPPHSIAVLPFVNLSGDKEQEYFSDGLTEELLNSLAEINELQVAARTSSFYFKGKDVDLGTVAHKLNVGAVLEGSVRRSDHTIRITAQLVNAVTGFHLWSKTYDRDLGDVLKLQTEIATSVASALKVTLLGDIAAKIELGGTHNPAAFDAYLRGAKAYISRNEGNDTPTAIAAYTEAIRLDPHYALAFAGRSMAFSSYAGEATTTAAAREAIDMAQTDARQALALAPDLAQAHLALAFVSENGTLDFTQANDEYERALSLAPGNAEVLRRSGSFVADMGHFDAGIATARRAVVLDPVAREIHGWLGRALYAARRYQEAVAAFAEVIRLEPYKAIYGDLGFAYYGLGDLQRARASCETNPDYWLSQQCLAVIYEKLGRHADAEAVLAKLKAALGDTAAYQYATIYAQWRNPTKALDWLETALRLRDPGLELLKTDPLLDPLRQEPRFQAVMRELKFPS